MQHWDQESQPTQRVIDLDMEITKSRKSCADASTEAANKENIYLIIGNQKVRIHAERVSKYSLLFRYDENSIFFDPNKPVWLILENNRQSVKVGPCRILLELKQNRHTDRIIFTDTAYDFQSLLFDKKVTKLPSVLGDLPLVFGYKERIRQSFKTYVADLRYDLKVYKDLLDEIDSKFRKEPAEVQNVLQMAIIETEGQNFRRFFENKLHELNCLVDDFSPEEHQYHGFYFRKQLWDFILCCPFAARAYLKPRGYAGDSEQMRMIYRNDFQGASTFSKLLHKHAVEHAASQSVRNRIRLIAQRLRNFRDCCQGSMHEGRLKVLSVGCGSAFELKDIIKIPEDCDKYHFVLFDQDAVALSEAADLIREIENKLSARLKVDYVQGSVRFMLFSRQFRQKWGKFQYIYSMGLFDYLTCRVAKAVLDRLYRLLENGGQLVVGNYHVSNSSKYYMEYWGDWPILHRTEEEFRGLFTDESSGRTSMIYDDTGIQMFLCIEKLHDNA